jgi:hypothetical protein
VPDQPVRAGPVPESCSGQGSGVDPVQAPGWPVHRPAAPDISRKADRALSLMTQNYEEIVRRFQRLVQGNIDLKKSKHKLEGYSIRIKMIMNQNQNNLTTQETHDQKPQWMHKFKIGGKIIAEDYSPYV